jgi:hypothetical protein
VLACTKDKECSMSAALDTDVCTCTDACTCVACAPRVPQSAVIFGIPVRIVPLQSPLAGDPYARIHFPDGRFLEIAGASAGWPEGL